MTTGITRLLLAGIAGLGLVIGAANHRAEVAYAEAYPATAQAAVQQLGAVIPDESVYFTASFADAVDGKVHVWEFPDGNSLTLWRPTENGWVFRFSAGGDLLTISGPKVLDWSPDQSITLDESQLRLCEDHGSGWHRSQVPEGTTVRWWGFQISIYWFFCPRQAEQQPSQVATPAPTVVSSGPAVRCPIGVDAFVQGFPGTIASQWTLYPPNGAQYNGQTLSVTVPQGMVIDFGTRRLKAGEQFTASSFTAYFLACDP